MTIAAFMTAFVLPAVADTKGALTLTGHVPWTLQASMTVSSSAILPHPMDARHDGAVVLITLYNNGAGYEVTLSSRNARGRDDSFPASAGPFRQAGLPYVVDCNGSPVHLKSGTAVITDASGTTSSRGRLRRVAISVESDPTNREAGAYEDELVLTIAAK